MDLHNLEQQRDAYSGRIGKLAIQIALIFALPAGVALALFKWMQIPVLYTLPVAFIASWVMVISLYRRVDRKVRDLENKIINLKKQEEVQSSDTDEH